MTGDRRYAYDGLDVIADLDGSDQVVAGYTHGLGIDDPLIMRYQGNNYFYHKNHLGSITGITDSNGSTAKTYQYEAFGKIRSMSGALTYNPFVYTARERHVASGLYYYRARWYDPQLGRFITQDPIGHLGGVNLYAYVKNDPANWLDPLGLHAVHYDGYVVTLLDDQGEVVDTYRASSGAIGHMNPKYQNCPNGPIPEGTYSFDPVDFSEAGLGRKLLWILFGQDWGNYRVPIEPDPATEAYIKSLNRTGGYFIHGGKVEGTSGCIDLGDRDVDFYNELKEHEGRIPVTVKY